MKKIVASGKTIEEAVQSGLSQLQVARDRVAVNVLEQPSKGLFGLFGVRAAKVELLLDDEPTAAAAAADAPVAAAEASPPVEHLPEAAAEAGTQSKDEADSVEAAIAAAERFLADVTDSMGLPVTIHRRRTRDGLLLELAGSGDMGMVIGRRGQTLDALQYLANIVANRQSDSHIRIVLDAEDFRERRRKTLEDLSDRLAGRVVRTGKEVVLEPMPPQERKVIHSKLQHHPRVKTMSKGDEPNRRVVISLK